jgi:hypothetical protein
MKNFYSLSNMRLFLTWSFTILAIVFKIYFLDNPIPLSDNVAFTTISESEAQTLFDTLANLDYIEFRYANNHCEDRAHAMSYEIAQKGIKAGKAWIFVRGIFDNKFPKVLKINDANKVGKNGLLTWKYHVAPVIMSEKGDTLVLDPSLCKTPVTLKEWFYKMNVKDDVVLDDIFFLIKDWQYQTYVSKDKQARLFEPWRLDKDFEMTKKGLCEGKICQQFLIENPQDSTVREQSKKFSTLPKAYQKKKKVCLEILNQRIN